ncbi:MAG: EpsI family protein, partial [Deltaproteobacteria bacterium]|nr:EpsI family protein [Deltaproteobacteria bacterium]
MIPARRLAVLCAFFLATAFFLYTMGEGRTVPLKRPVASFPEHIGPWRQVANEPLTAKVVAILGVDDYLNADYADAQGRRLNFYFSYFTRMDGSKAFHSPRNCMPGAGWDVISLEPLAVRIPGSEKKLSINRMVLQKGNRYQVVLYWYQGRGRVMRSE